MRQKYDVVIVGASFAGLTLAHYLPKTYKILVIDKKPTLDHAIETTGLVTQATYDLLKDFTNIDEYIPNKITAIGVVDTDYEEYFFSYTDEPWIYSTDTPNLVKHMAETVPSNVTVRIQTELKDLKYTDNDVLVVCQKNGEQLEYEAGFIVGADGAFSKVARLNQQLDKNSKFLAGFEKVFFGEIKLGERPENSVYHFWFGEFSLGYGGWLSPTIINGRKAFRLGLAKHKKDILEWVKINEFVKILQERKIIEIEPNTEEQVHFSSLIPIGGPLKKVYCDRTLLLGDAAGLCGAFAADGIKGAIVSGKVAAKLIPRYLSGNHDALCEYHQLIQQNQHLMTYYKKQILYRFIWDLMLSDRTFKAMFNLIKRQKDGFLNQFCDSKDRNKSLMWVILKWKNLPSLFYYGWFLFLDVCKKLFRAVSSLGRK